MCRDVAVQRLSYVIYDFVLLNVMKCNILDVAVQCIVLDVAVQCIVLDVAVQCIVLDVAVQRLYAHIF
jgi:ABC-type phosphonate transport system ATPase subunit